MPSDLVRFSIAIPSPLLEEFDKYTAQRGLLVNRSESIRNLIRDALVSEQLTDPASSIVGSITLVFDHHTQDLTRKIDDVEHNYPDEIVSSMHVHLDHHNCLEIIAVRGICSKVEEMANCILGIKGIKYGKLTVVNAVGNDEWDESGHSHSHPFEHPYDHDYDHDHDHAHPHDHLHGHAHPHAHDGVAVPQLAHVHPHAGMQGMTDEQAHEWAHAYGMPHEHHRPTDGDEA